MKNSWIQKLGLVLISLALTQCAVRPIDRSPNSFRSKTQELVAYQKAMADLRALLEPRVLVLDHPLLTFHYERTDQHLTDVASVGTYISKYIRAFYDETFVAGGEAGPGVYVALDSYASRGYGGPDPQLYVLPIKEGTPLLNLSIREREPEAARGFAIMTDLGCPLPEHESMREGFAHFFSEMRQSKDRICRQVMIDVVRQLGVQGTMYGWGGTSEVRASRAFRPDAIALTSADAIVLDEVSLFSNTVRITRDPALGGYVRRLFDDFRNEYKVRVAPFSSFEEAPLKLGSPSRRTRQFKRWRNFNIGYFGPDRAIGADTKFVADFYRKMKDVYVDQPARQLILALKKVVPTEWEYLAVHRFNGIERMAATAAGVSEDPTEFRNWQRAHDLMYTQASTRQKRLKMINQSLRENNPYVSDRNLLENFSSARLGAIPAGPAMIFDLLADLKVGPKLKWLYANTVLNEIHAVPLITDPQSSLDANYLAANARVFRNFLERCLVAYSAPDRDLARLQAGECGIRQAEMFD